MKKIYLLLTASLILISLNTFAQIDTSGGRYYQELFPTVTITSNISYGSNVKYNGQTQTLVMDIYEPTGDTVQLRPLIVFAHGGSFIGGTKTDGDVTALCTRFAKMGYVTASIEYRIGMFPIDSVNAIKAVLRATQDMKAAVRWFRQDAAGTNAYGIHTNYIFIGGSSAGAFMALHHAYMDKVSEFPLGATTLTSMGGMEGTSGNPGWPTDALAVVNLCGALGDSAYMEPGDIPLVSMHGTNDGIVPYGTAMISIVIFQIMVVDGSASIKERADNLGILNPFHTFIGADHVPYAGGGAVPAAYMDTTVWFVRDFLRPFLGIPVPITVSENNLSNEISVYPNPATGKFTINSLQSEIKAIEIYSAMGQKVFQSQYSMLNTQISIDVSKWSEGIFFLKITDENNFSAVKKIVVE